MKTCSKCGEDKPLSEFYPKNRKGKESYAYICKVCSLEKSKEYRRKNRDRLIQYQRKWRLENKELADMQTKIWRINNPKKVKDGDSKRHKTARKNCSKFYIKNQLVQRGFLPEQITPELIAAYRAMIKLKRAVKEIEV